MAPVETRQCANCGAAFAVLARVARGHSARFCSRDCFFAARRGPPRTCETCGTSFHASPSAGAAGRGRFCSLPCARRSRRTKRPSVVCAVCGIAFEVGRGHSPDQIYCSPACRGKADRVRVECTCGVCGKIFERRPSEIAAGRGHFCSVACYRAKQRSSPPTCAVCGQTRPRGQRFCSRACAGLDRRKGTERACVCCGTTFYAPQFRSDARFCSHACAAKARRKRLTKSCDCCGTRFEVKANRSAARFCSRACWSKATAASRTVQCEVCRRIVKARSHQPGRFCSHRCQGKADRKPKVQSRCDQCGRIYWVPGRHKATRRFCCRACYLDRQDFSRRANCEACGGTMKRRRHGQRFCSLACAFVGRTPRRPDEANRARNDHIVALATGTGHLSSTAIERALAKEHREWTITASGVRAILARSRRG